MKRGNIVLVKFPFTDLSAKKRRPALVISKKPSSSSDVILAFITSVIPHKLEGSDYFIPNNHKDFQSSGLKKPSLVKLDKLTTVNTSIISGTMGELSNSTMQEIDTKLKLALGLK